MTKVIINRWDGGHAEDIRTHNTNESEESYQFDILDTPHVLQPVRETVADTVGTNDMDYYKILSTVYVGAIGYIGLGRVSTSDGNPKIMRKTDINSVWNASYAEDTSGVPLADTLVSYYDKAFWLRTDAGGTVLSSYAIDVITTEGTITDSYAGAEPSIRPFVHPEDNILYGVVGNTIFKYVGGTDTFSEHDSILPADVTYTSITDYGSYLAISGYKDNKSIVYLWGRDTTLNTLQGVIDFGTGRLKIIENMGNTLVGIMSPNASSTVKSPKIFIKQWAGGAVDTIKVIPTSSYTNIPNTRTKSKGVLYFSDSNEYIYALGLNKNNQWALSKYCDVGISNSNITSIVAYDDILQITGSATPNYARIINPNGTFTETAVYKTSINPNMYIEDRYEDKQLDGVYIAYTGASSGNLVVKYSVDGSAMTTIISESNETGEKIKFTSAENDGKPFINGREFQFQIESTGGAKIKELGYYYTKIKHSN